MSDIDDREKNRKWNRKQEKFISKKEKKRKNEPKPFNDESKRDHNSGGKYESISNHNPQVHTIICCQFVEQINSSVHYLNHHHQYCRL